VTGTLNGILFIAWDEADDPAYFPIGLIALFPQAKLGYSNNNSRFTTSATLRSVEEIFKLSLLGNAVNSGNPSVLQLAC
jgi:hypothetical protein